MEEVYLEGKRTRHWRRQNAVKCRQNQRKIVLRKRKDRRIEDSKQFICVSFSASPCVLSPFSQCLLNIYLLPSEVTAINTCFRRQTKRRLCWDGCESTTQKNLELIDLCQVTVSDQRYYRTQIRAYTHHAVNFVSQHQHNRHKTRCAHRCCLMICGMDVQLYPSLYHLNSYSNPPPTTFV